MKKTITLVLAVMTAMSISAQMRVWGNGDIKYEREVSLIDSITFVHKSEPIAPDSPQNPNFHAKAFTVNAEGKQVAFSQGNLQYNAAADVWRFAEKQYDVIGTDIDNISSTYDGWIDLFGWGTSGWKSGANAYQPYSTSVDAKDYYPGGSYTNDITGDYANADWGVYNAIANGGNKAGLWRTLTSEEWFYIFDTRENAQYLRSQATVCGVHGYLLLPDDFKKPDAISWSHQTNDWTTNNYNTNEWYLLEENGAVFLPCAGYRGGVTCFNLGLNGYYWLSSAYDDLSAKVIYFSETYAYSSIWNYRCNGQSVRLVQDF